MARPERIESLDDVFVWIAEHDGRIDAYWEAQHARNTEQDKKDKAFDLRLTSIERKVMWVAGAASTIGAGGGATLATFLLGG